MHIPPHYKRPSWQRFLLGVVAGAFFAYLLLIFMYGTMYEQIVHENSTLRASNKELTKYNEALIEDQEEAEERQKAPYTIERIQIDIENEKELRLDRLAIHQLEELLIEEIDIVIGKSVSSVAENNVLLIAAIENKTFKVDDFTYTFTVKKFILYATVLITLEAKIAS